MSETEGPGEEPTSAAKGHRAPPPARSVADRVLPPLAAVAVVIIVIVLLIVINGHGSDGSSAAAVKSATPAPTPTVVASVTAIKPSTKPPVPTSPPTSSRPPKPTKSPKPKPSHPHSASPKPTVVAMAPVQVLNNSRITGLAHHVAAEVQAQGWTITFVGNLQGRVPETTVYYALGDGAAAVHLAHEFSSIRRVEPNSEGGIHASNLTLVATSDWVQ